ncbi:hypothetical protein L208DRAFT_1471382, partial [Tricholoma matsutake]
MHRFPQCKRLSKIDSTSYWGSPLITVGSGGGCEWRPRNGSGGAGRSLMTWKTGWSL